MRIRNLFGFDFIVAIWIQQSSFQFQVCCVFIGTPEFTFIALPVAQTAQMHVHENKTIITCGLNVRLHVSVCKCQLIYLFTCIFAS